MKHYGDYYADGAFRRCTGDTTVPVVDPTTEATIADVRFCSAADVDAAVDGARRGFAAWRSSTVDARKAALARLHDEMAARGEAFAQALAGEIGCPVWLARLMQVPMPLRGLELAIDGLDRIEWTETIGNGVVERVPAGVVVAITPWNFPLHQIVAKVAAVIGAGCAVVLKPSEVAPGAARLFADAVDAVVQAGALPAGVVNLVWGGADVGRQLVGHRGVDRVSFTGSTAVGRQIMADAARTLKPVTLELGGKSAAVLLDDADLDAALPVVLRMCVANSGQACVSQSRLIVPERLVDAVVDRFPALTAAWPLGDPHDAATRLGPLATAAQFDHVRNMIERASHDGATLCAGGPGRAPGFDTGWYVAPTLFRDVRPQMEIAQQEVFGPVLALLSYRDEADALAIANGTAYGLSGAVWSASAERATQFARGLETGQVVVNGAAQNLATPFGGWGASGFGRENGRFGIEDLLNYRSVHGAA